jgi:nitroreductase
MDTFDAIRTLLAVRSYQDKPVPPEVVRRIVEAAWLTGSSMNKQPWHFIVVQDKETLRKLGELAKTGPYTAGAALAVVVAVEQTRFSLSDASRAVQSMMIAAWADGVGSNWVGFSGMNQVKPVLGIPEELDVVAVVPFGYPVKKIGKGRKNRKPFGEVIHREGFGQPFE